MNEEAALLELAQSLARREGNRRTAGRLFNIAALLLAESGITDEELSTRLRVAFQTFPVGNIYGERH